MCDLVTLTAAFGANEARRKTADAKREAKKRAISTNLLTSERSQRTDEKQQRIGRSSLVGTSPQGLLNPERVGRRKLTVA